MNNPLGQLCMFTDWKLSTCRWRNKSKGIFYRCTIWPQSEAELAAMRGPVSDTGKTPHEAIEKAIAKAKAPKVLKRFVKPNQAAIESARQTRGYMKLVMD